MRRSLVPVVALMAAACVRSPDPFSYVEPALSVHGLLHASDTGVRVSILRGSGSTPISSGARVELVSGATTVRLEDLPTEACFDGYDPTPDPARRRCFGATLPEPIASGSRWRLEADVAPGEAVTASTTVPAAPGVVRPAPRARVPYARSYGPQPPAELEVEWQTAAAPRVEVHLSEGQPFRGGQAVPGARCYLGVGEITAAVGVPAGSRRVTIQDVYCFRPDQPEVAWDSVVATVVVTAFDSAYAQFALRGRSVTRNPPGAALQGAYGVFGAAASTRREFVVVPRP